MLREKLLDRQPVSEEYLQTLQILSEGSVRRHFDPHLDIEWDSAEMMVDPDDPRWVLDPQRDSLGATSWYQSLPLQRRIELGRWSIANTVKVGAAFETMLIRAMMQYLAKLPNNSPEFRYCLHEITEECNHIQMFQEAVNRIGADVPGMRPWFRRLSPLIGLIGGMLPVAMFFGILGGEEPIDHHQKQVLRSDADLPPVVLRTMEIHVAEEARHISFAMEYVRQYYPRLSRWRRGFYSILAPLWLRYVVTQIMAPHPNMVKQFDIPRQVVREAFWNGATGRRLLAGYLRDTRTLAGELGMLNPIAAMLWKKLGVYGDFSRYRGEPDRSHYVA
ncbi:hypothetical protein C1Y40_01475 [Mycobacterium talmoniae]|uniref:Diiron oxygenase n=1 Tax=Mycobacterium talmoniae TaxID=1858794 RepID=A0A1S1NF64_9MYCO|nr:hypothetical protein BKN37_17060 [Mycobacterium talmoniae]PQM48303.1 hypothetical protein C1Y40_01475 [Mycobacterium talmoniae]TDH48193.1 diiron oxygenase [Mycobacterium eburneum]